MENSFYNNYLYKLNSSCSRRVGPMLVLQIIKYWLLIFVKKIILIINVTDINNNYPMQFFILKLNSIFDVISTFFDKSNISTRAIVYVN